MNVIDELEQRVKAFEWKFSGNVWASWEHGFVHAWMTLPNMRLTAPGKDRPEVGDTLLSNMPNRGAVGNADIAIFRVDKVGMAVVFPGTACIEERYCIDCVLQGFLKEALLSHKENHPRSFSSLLCQLGIV